MRHRRPIRSQLKCTKYRYCVRNWPEYEAGLRKRDDLTLWFSEEVIAVSRAPPIETSGGQAVSSDLAIEAGLSVRLVNGLALRQTEGFLQSISTLINLAFRIHNRATLSRRSNDLNGRIPAVNATGRRQWAHDSGYTRRSLVETAVSR